jgi:death-on-curing family protein
MGDLKVAHRVLSEVFADDAEPLPAWHEADRDKLETCRCSIEVEAFGVRKYDDVESCAAKLFYSTIKNHAFPNGNKRYALVLTLLFLLKNGRMLTVAEGVNARTAKWVADSNPHTPEGSPDVIVGVLTTFYRENSGPAPRK